MRMNISVMLLVVLYVCFGASSSAAAKKVALVIGNDKYTELPPLQKGGNDALSVAWALDDIGFIVELAVNLTRSETKSKIFGFIHRIEPGDTAFFFFSGHGVALGGKNFLLPVDAPLSSDPDLVRNEAHDFDDIIERVRQNGAAVSFFVLDPCRNNPFATSGNRSCESSKGVHVAAPPSGSFVLMAAGAGQEALDRLSASDTNPNSVFTRHLLPLLSEKGLSHTDLAKQVQKKVADAAKEVGHIQEPVFFDQIRDTIFLVPDQREATVEAQYNLFDLCLDSTAHWIEIRDTKDSSLLNNYERRFGECTFLMLAR